MEQGRSMFRWRRTTYCEADDGLVLAMPNPWNEARTVYILAANSALEIYHMTRRPLSFPSWALWKGEQVIEKGYFPVEPFSVEITAK
jgi:hypothetical protein